MKAYCAETQEVLSKLETDAVNGLSSDKVVELQNKFGGEKFTVLGANVWDEEDKFKAALTAEGINYPQIYVPRDNKDDATALYGIRGIPQIILFGPDGVIVKRDLRGEAMKKLIEEKMK